jgi:hypothetical protein
MAIVIELKRSSVPGKVPTTTELALGELAINTYDGKLYLKKNTNGSETVVDITSGGGGSGSGTVTSVGTAGSVNGITLTGGPITSTGTVTLGGTLSNILNNQLANSSLTIGSTNISLGGTVSTLAGLTSVTATNFIGNIIGSITSASYAGTSSRVDTSFINTNTDYYVTFVEGTSDGNKSLYSDTSISYNPSTNLLSTSRIYAVQITGSLFGTASFATTASFALNSNINTGSFATTDSNTFNGNQIIQSGILKIGNTSSPSKIGIGSDISGSTTAYGISVDSNLDVGVTTNAVSYRSFPIQTSGGPFTAVTHYLASTNTFLGTVINQYGFYADSSLNGATNNYGFYGNIASSGLSRYNLYMPGTAPNYLQGNTSIGKVSASTALDISGSTLITGSLTVTQPITGSLFGTASFATTASFALNAGGGSIINTGSFATTGSNNFNGNQTITGSLTLSSSADIELNVIGNQRITGSLTISSSNEPLTIINPTPGYTPSSPTALTLKSEYSGSSIEFWNYDTEENSPSGMFKSGYISANPYFADASLTFGTKYNFKFKQFGPYDYTGSIISGVNPIGNTLLDINGSQVSSSVPIVAPSFTGTASFASTASFLLGSIASAVSASYARTASIATTADAATTITTVNNTGDAIRYLVWAATGAGNRTPNITTQRFVVNSATGSMGIGKSTISTGYNLDVSGSVLISGSLVVTSSVSASTLGQFTGNNNGFVEFFIRNSNNGVSASSDIAVYNNSGSALLNHIDMGINSSNIAAGYSFGRGNDSYVYNTGGDLFIGNSTAFYQPTVQSQSLYLFANSAGTPDLTITGSRIGIQKSGSLNATLDISGSVIITGSVQGNVSALTISSNTSSIDLNLGNFFTLTLSGSTHFTATNIKPGQTVNILLTTNATNNSASFNSTIFRQPSGSAYTPTGVNGAKDILTFISYDTTNLYVASIKNMI